MPRIECNTHDGFSLVNKIFFIGRSPDEFYDGMERITLLVLFFAICTLIHCDENGVWLRTSCKIFCIEKVCFI